MIPQLNIYSSPGPLTYTEPENNRVYQAGIISTGMNCADPKYPGVYIKVARLLNFIYLHADISEWQCRTLA